MRNFLNKIYDKFVITSSAVITALVGMSAMIVAIAGIIDSKEVYYVALAFIGLAFIYGLYMLFSKAQRRARIAISKNNLKLVRDSKLKIQESKTRKAAIKESKAENKANRL